MIETKFVFIKRGNLNPEFQFRNLAEFLEIEVIKPLIEDTYFERFGFDEFRVVIYDKDQDCIGVCGYIHDISDKLKKEIEGFRK